ncbi:unnamed protein product [Protopolystoma xenopodis]|uniref:Uncharacterized protein n=1 Tax=Protopolystoma xenopodis TaxID=117903 RepID=A0A3S5FCE2_9PLAT|nr:unnamed protein product [Protopolystoma xenopodis]
MVLACTLHDLRIIVYLEAIAALTTGTTVIKNEYGTTFQQLAQAGVLVVLPKLAQLGVPTKRPDDYFAEMIRKRLIVTEKRLELRDRARQLREGRKFGKQMQLQVVQARRDERKRLNEAVKSARAHGKGMSLGW